MFKKEGATVQLYLLPPVVAGAPHIKIQIFSNKKLSYSPLILDSIEIVGFKIREIFK